MSDREAWMNKAIDAGEAIWGQIVDEWSEGYCRSAATPLMDQNQAFLEGYLNGRTVTAEQVEAVARVLDGQNGNLFNEEALAEDSLEAAGLLIEGEEHE